MCVCVCVCLCVCVCDVVMVLGDDHRLLMCFMILLCYNFLTTPNYMCLCVGGCWVGVVLLPVL